MTKLKNVAMWIGIIAMCALVSHMSFIDAIA